MIKLLLVEDDPSLCYIIKGGLEDVIGGYEIVTASNGEEGIKMWKEHHPQVIVADVEMPGMNGLEMVERIRETDTQTLIVFASGKVTPKDVTAGFKKGGNNYIKKPFIPEELDAHIQAMLKIREEVQLKSDSELRKLGKYSFDSVTKTLKDEDGKIIPLTQREGEILWVLIQNKGTVVKRESFLKEFWGTEGMDYYASRSLDVFINGIRKKLGSDSNIHIKTVKGIGISLVDE